MRPECSPFSPQSLFCTRSHPFGILGQTVTVSCFGHIHARHCMSIVCIIEREQTPSYSLDYHFRVLPTSTFHVIYQATVGRSSTYFDRHNT